ncbi:hypothetical protein GF378_00855 [Candidatus Pacearchaeota archaeon]|nr:hypothetical protein [Candidatus Pacearchaeota archaeon]
MYRKSKKLLGYNIALFVFIVSLIVVFVGLRYYEEYQNNLEEAEKQEQLSQSKYVPPSPKPSGNSISNNPSPKPAPAPRPKPKPKPEIKTASDEDYNRLETILPQNQVIQDLPDNARILLSFFNFNTGERQWERDYLIGKGSATQVSSMPNDLDMKMIMHSRNVPLLKEGNLCNVVATAKKNGDYATELVGSKTSLLWKYKGVMKYKDCLGL